MGPGSGPTPTSSQVCSPFLFSCSSGLRLRFYISLLGVLELCRAQDRELFLCTSIFAPLQTTRGTAPGSDAIDDLDHCLIHQLLDSLIDPLIDSHILRTFLEPDGTTLTQLSHP